MSAPDPRMPDVNHKPLSWFAPKKRNGRSPEEHRCDDVVEKLRDTDRRPLPEIIADIRQLPWDGPDNTPPAEPPPRNRLAELADLLRHLTYGEMVEFSTGIDGDANKIDKWSNK